MQALAQRLTDVAKRWHAFWFTPADPIIVSTMRWFVGGMLVYTLLVWGVDLEAFFSRTSGWQAEELTRRIQEGSWAQSLWWLIPEAYLWPFHLSCLFVVSLFWIGLATSITKWLALAIIISYSNRVPLANYGLDQINAVLTFYLCLSPCGERLSVDSLLRPRLPWRGFRIQPAMATGLAVRMIQVHFCIVYVWAGLSKLQGVSWWTGEAVWRAAANFEYQQFSLTWLAYVPWFVQIVSVTTWAWELAFPFLIWNRRLRLPMLLIGVGMHLGIGLFMGMWTFGLIMCFGYLAFVPAPVLHKILGRLRITDRDHDLLQADAQRERAATEQVGSSEATVDRGICSEQLQSRASSDLVVLVEPNLKNRLKVGEFLKRLGLECIPVTAWPEAVKVYHSLEARTVICNATRYELSELKYWTRQLGGSDGRDGELPKCIALIEQSADVPVPKPSEALWRVPMPVTESDLCALLDGHLPMHLFDRDVSGQSEGNYQHGEMSRIEVL